MSRLQVFKATLLGLLVVCLTIVVLYQFTDICLLNAVTLDGQPVEDWESKYELSSKKHLFDQPIESVATQILSQKGIVKVDFSYQLPGRIDISTNRFSAVCFVLDGKSGTLRGLDAFARVVALEQRHEDWEHPVLTGISSAPLHHFCSDPRVSRVIAELALLRNKQIDLYRLVDEIDFSHSGYLRLSLAGVPYQLKIRAEQLLNRLTEFIRFVEQFDRETKNVIAYDLRYDNMIIEAGTGK